MDEMKIQLRNGGILEPVISKLIINAIRKKFGCNVDIEINGLTVNMKDGKTKIGIDMNANIENSEFTKIIKSIGLD